MGPGEGGDGRMEAGVGLGGGGGDGRMEAGVGVGGSSRKLSPKV